MDKILKNWNRTTFVDLIAINVWHHLMEIFAMFLQAPLRQKNDITALYPSFESNFKGLRTMGKCEYWFHFKGHMFYKDRLSEFLSWATKYSALRFCMIIVQWHWLTHSSSRNLLVRNHNAETSDIWFVALLCDPLIRLAILCTSPWSLLLHRHFFENAGPGVHIFGVNHYWMDFYQDCSNII